ncbi:MAG: PCMD domain-containing protein [Candidatus Kapabacteria bacterium]|nr:PCMD domain-containing protein [Candidatus Kapabacteria bacterium]
MRLLIYIVIAAVMCTVARGQQQIPNAGLEEWTLFKGSGVYKDYEEPKEGWTSGNGVIHVAPGSDPVCEKVTNAHSGTYAAKLTTRSIFGQIASGSLFLGTFALDFANPASSAHRGIPYSGATPIAFRGYYIFRPVNGDSAAIYAMFTRWDGTKRVLLGEARRLIKTETAAWKEFSVEVPSFDQLPDSMSVVAASSAAGENFKGSVGSTLLVDDFSFSWGTSDVNEVAGLQAIRVFASSAIVPPHVNATNISAIDLLGRMIDLPAPDDAGRVDLSSCSTGFWFIVATDRAGKVVAHSHGDFLR